MRDFYRENGLAKEIKPPGPVAQKFCSDFTNVLKGLQGPVGSGKTTACIMHTLFRAAKQKLRLRPGKSGEGKQLVGRYRATFVRQDYRTLHRTTIPSWLSLFENSHPEGWSGARDAPAQHKLTLKIGADPKSGLERLIEMEVRFIAIGDLGAEAALRGFETTDIFLNEADTLDRDVFSYCMTRIGRYPPREAVGACLFCDFNAPNIDSWVYDVFIGAPMKGTAYYRQPGGMSPGAENLDNLPPDYYQKMVNGGDEFSIQRFVHNKIGYSREGKVVFPEFSADRHVAPQALLAIDELPVIIGVDAGGTPAATFWQHLADGQWVGLAELVSPEDETTGVSRFAEALLRKITEVCPRNRLLIVADPAAAYGADSAGNELSWLMMLGKRLNHRVKPGRSQILTERLEVVRRSLRLNLGAKSGFVISPSMRHLRSGFEGKYRYKKQPLSKTYSERPEKNFSSHVQDSAQYALMEDGGIEALRSNNYNRYNPKSRRQVLALTGDNPQGVYEGR